MEVSIKAKSPVLWFTNGKHVEVSVRCTADEVRAIQTYDLFKVPIIDGAPSSASETRNGSLFIQTFDSVYRFNDFCRGISSWHAHTDDDAREFITALEDGFLDFHKLLDAKLREQASSPPTVTLDSTVKDLLYEYATKKPDAT